MRALVTGATGFIGGRLARALLARGDEIAVLVRHPSKAAALETLGARIVPGDITDEESVARAAAGMDALYHFAAQYAFGVADRAALYRVNVEGTRAVLRAAAGAGVARVVYCSSVAAIGNDPSGRVADETTTHHGRFTSAYEESKWRAHAVAREQAAAGVPVITVLPAAVYGPGDTSLMGSMMRLYARGVLWACPFLSTGISLVHVDDVAAGAIAACSGGVTGEDYILGGDNETIGGAFRRAAAVTGIRAPRLDVPAWLVRPFLPVAARAMSHTTAALREGMATLSGSLLYSSAKAERTFGYGFRPIEEGFAECVAAIRAGRTEPGVA